MRRTVAVTLIAIVVACQVFDLSPLVDVVRNQPPDAGVLRYPLAHVLFAPLSLPADLLNGGSRAELIGFFGWALVGYALARLASRRVSRWRETLYATVFLLSLAAFSAWLVYLPRAIPRFDAGHPDALVFDVHSHSSASRDGRPGFSAAANAAWHGRAGFHAAFLTDHNAFGAAREWRAEREAGAVRLLDGEELSLRGLHLIVLGNREAISNAPWNDSWDSTLMLVRRLAASADRPYLIASLPEYWKHQWGTNIARMVEAGVEGFEIWTTSPKGMEIPDSSRREVAARAVVEGRGLFGATDMHGIGHTAAVWNVASLPGWRSLSDSALTAALIQSFRGESPRHAVVALRRHLPDSKAGSLFAIPLGLLTSLRAASAAHALSLIGWLALLLLPIRIRR